MSMLFWRKNSRIDAFARRMADDFFSRVQPQSVAAHYARDGTPSQGKPDGKARHGSTDAKRQQIERSIDDLAVKLAQFKATEKLGIYGKARLHMTLVNRLSELGFSQPSVQELNYSLLLKSP